MRAAAPALCAAAAYLHAAVYSLLTSFDRLYAGGTLTLFVRWAFTCNKLTKS